MNPRNRLRLEKKWVFVCEYGPGREKNKEGKTKQCDDMTECLEVFTVVRENDKIGLLGVLNVKVGCLSWNSGC